VLKRLLAALAALVSAHPRRVALLVLIPSLLLGLDALRHPVDLAFTGIVPRDHVLMQRYETLAQEVNFGGRMPILLEGPEEALDAAVAAVVPALDALDAVDGVTGELPVDWLTDQAPYLVERELFDAWLGFATDPSNPDNAQVLADGLQALQAEVADRTTAQSGTRLLMVQMAQDPMAIDLGDPAYFDVETALGAALEGTPVSGTAAGISAIAAQDQVRTLGRISWLTPFSLLFVIALLTRVERRPVWLATLALPMVLSLAVTLGLVGELLGLITIMESFFGIMVFGLGVDFGLHLMVRLREERAAGRSFDDALRVTWEGTGRGVVAGGITTAGAFTIMSLAPDPGMRHLGASGALGLLSCLVLMLTLLPAAWAWLDAREGAPPPVKPFVVPGLQAFASHAARHPWLHLGVAAAVVVVALAGTPRLSFETDLARIFNREVPALDALYRIQDLYGINTSPWISVVDSVDEAREFADGYEADPLFETVVSVASVLQPDAAERHAALQAAAEDIRVRRATLSALVPIAFVRRAELMGAVGLLDALEQARGQGAPGLQDLPPALQDLFVTDAGRLLVYAYPAQASLDGMVARTERLAAEQVDPEAAGFGALLELMTAIDQPWVVPVLLGVVGFVGVVLIVDLRRPRWILLAMTPVVVGTVVTFGTLCWLGDPFNTLTITVVPLIIGLGVDDGIHVVHRMLEDPTASPDLAAASVGQAITMTTLTTCASFSVLMFADHAGMEGMAKVMLIGLPVCLLASVSLVPALAVLTAQAGSTSRASATAGHPQ
jgi:predicted RND superfamily exporter protein